VGVLPQDRTGTLTQESIDVRVKWRSNEGEHGRTIEQTCVSVLVHSQERTRTRKHDLAAVLH
jgi:magnesium-transporting ATPase (P-type)